MKRENFNTDDRLSELPDAILAHILSFLDTKYAVQTSSLSKRWINLWISVTNLNFHNSSFRKLTSFQRFVDHVLTRRDNSISLNSIVFNCNKTITLKCFEKVLICAKANGVKNLEVCMYCISRRSFFFIPNYTFSGSPLRILKLKCPGYCREIKTPFCLAQVQSLSLDGFLFDGLYLFSKCPNLVELSIIGCDVKGSKKRIISAPQLERLNIALCINFSQISKIVLSSPKLTLFNFKAPNPVLLRSDELVHLRTVTIDLGYYYGSFEKEYTRTAMKMLQMLHNGEHVTLSMQTIEYLYMITGVRKISPSPFDNLKSLKIIAGKIKQPFDYNGPILNHKRICLNAFNQVINYFLQNSPQAEMVLELPR
ncbi:hypothetical protein LguiA_030662 [Lonicera macranthoides]